MQVDLKVSHFVHTSEAVTKAVLSGNVAQSVCCVALCWCGVVLHHDVQHR